MQVMHVEMSDVRVELRDLDAQVILCDVRPAAYAGALFE